MTKQKGNTMLECNRKYLRKLFMLQIKARAECEDESNIINKESVLFLKEFGERREFGEPKFIGKMRNFYKSIAIL